MIVKTDGWFAALEDNILYPGSWGSRQVSERSVSSSDRCPRIPAAGAGRRSAPGSTSPWSPMGCQSCLQTGPTLPASKQCLWHQECKWRLPILDVRDIILKQFNRIHQKGLSISAVFSALKWMGRGSVWWPWTCSPPELLVVARLCSRWSLTIRCTVWIDFSGLSTSAYWRHLWFVKNKPRGNEPSIFEQ